MAETLKTDVQTDTQRLIVKDLSDAGIDPNSPEADEFRARVSAFGIMGVQPPIQSADSIKLLTAR